LISIHAIRARWGGSYAIFAVVGAGIVCGIATPRHTQYPPDVYNPRELKTLFQNADRVS